MDGGEQFVLLERVGLQRCDRGEIASVVGVGEDATDAGQYVIGRDEESRPTVPGLDCARNVSQFPPPAVRPR